MSCAVRDCGNPLCRCCWWARQPVQGRSASAVDLNRRDYREVKRALYRAFYHEGMPAESDEEWV